MPRSQFIRTLAIAIALLGGSCMAQEHAGTAAAETSQTVVVEGHRIKSKGAPYRFLRKLLDMYADAARPESPDLYASLVWTDIRKGGQLILATLDSRQALPVSAQGVFTLPDLNDTLATDSKLQSSDGQGLGVHPVLLVKLPLAAEFNGSHLSELVAQANAARRHFPWYIRLARLGQSGTTFTGVRFCLQEPASGIRVADKRVAPDSRGCIALQAGADAAAGNGPITFESPPMLAELITAPKP